MSSTLYITNGYDESISRARLTSVRLMSVNTYWVDCMGSNGTIAPVVPPVPAPSSTILQTEPACEICATV